MVAIGDFNGDGQLDIATANTYSNTVSVLLGSSDRTFETRIDQATGLGPAALALGDLDGDSKLDIVTANAVTDSASVLWGTGDGTFRQARWGTGAAPISVAIEDFDSDGAMDLAVANNASGTVSLLKGRADGTFATKVDVPTGASPVAMVVGDFNGDGRPDLATASAYSNTVSLLIGSAGGTFRPMTVTPLGFEPSAIGAADFDGDGNSDLVLADQASGMVRVLLGRRQGAPVPAVDSSTGAGSILPSLAVADFNHDGKVDLAVADTTACEVRVVLGNKDGTFQAPARFITGPGPVSLVVGDFTGDGQLDLATANEGGASVSVLPGNGDGTFKAKIDSGAALGTAAPGALSASDYDGDGNLDLAVAYPRDNTLGVLAGKGNGTFVLTHTYGTGSTPVWIASGDLTGDGRPDVVAANSEAGDVSVLLGVCRP